MMVRYMCGMSLKDRKPSAQYFGNPVLAVNCLINLIGSSRLIGHVLSAHRAWASGCSLSKYQRIQTSGESKQDFGCCVEFFQRAFCSVFHILFSFSHFVQFFLQFL